MKRAFLLKQIDSMQSQVDSLLENVITEKAAELADSFKQFISKPVRNMKESMDIYWTEYWEGDTLSGKIKIYSKKLIIWARDVSENAEDLLNNHVPGGKSIIEFTRRLISEIEKIKVNWESNTPEVLKYQMLVGFLLLMAAACFMLLKEGVSDTIKKLFSSLTSSISTSFTKVSAAISKAFSGGFVNGVKEIGKAIFELIAAPFKAIWNFADSLVSTGAASVIAVAICYFAGVAYYIHQNSK